MDQEDAKGHLNEVQHKPGSNDSIACKRKSDVQRNFKFECYINIMVTSKCIIQ